MDTGWTHDRHKIAIPDGVTDIYGQWITVKEMASGIHGGLHSPVPKPYEVNTLPQPLEVTVGRKITIACLMKVGLIRPIAIIDDLL